MIKNESCSSIYGLLSQDQCRRHRMRRDVECYFYTAIRPLHRVSVCWHSGPKENVALTSTVDAHFLDTVWKVNDRVIVQSLLKAFLFSLFLMLLVAVVVAFFKHSFMRRALILCHRCFDVLFEMFFKQRR